MKTFLTSFFTVLSIFIIGQNNIYVTYTCFDVKGKYPKPYEIKHKTTLNIQNNIAQYHFNRPYTLVEESNKRAEYNNLQYINNYNIVKNKITEQRLFKNAKLKTSWRPNYNWKITNETKQIAGYTVKKAIGTSIEINIDLYPDFHFGNVIAWFTEDIPIPAGPERYCGLPGLLLEIRYENNRYRHIVLDKIEFKKKTPQINIKDGLFVEDNRVIIDAFHDKHKTYIRQYIKSNK